MQFVFMDYSPFYYKTVAKKTVPAKRTGKFVQIRGTDKEYLVLSPKDLSSFHANIAERFFSEKGVSGSYNAKRDHYTISAGDWEIIGGGVWTINEKEKSFHLTGSSLAYGRYDRRGLQEKITAVPELSGFSIVIE